MGQNYKQKVIENLLKSMPPLEDRQDKEELFRKVSNRIEKKDVKKKKRFYIWLVPSAVSALVLLLLMTMSPGFFEMKFNESAIEESQMMSEDKGESSNNEEGLRIAEESQTESAEPTTEGPISFGESSIPLTFQPSLREKVIITKPQNQTVITTAVPDEQAQYLIPFSFLLPFSINSKEEYYNQLPSYLREEEWGTGPFPLKDWKYQFIPENQQVVAHVPATSKLTEDGAVKSEIEAILSYMFRSQNTKSIVFQRAGEKEFGLENTEKPLEDLAITPLQKQSYKYYRLENDQPEFMIPVPLNENTSIKQAMEEMKKSESKFHVYASIPERVNISTKTDGEQLTVTLKGKEVSSDSLKAQRILEAILMTAKSFGYQLVRFDLPVDKVGPYQMDQSIPVPVAANPFYVK